MAVAIFDAVKLRSSPSQSGVLLPAVGAAGVPVTATATVPAGPGQPLTEAMTEYVPASAGTTVDLVGF